MIEKIEIQNYAIIDKMNLQISEGLTTITGETGAGKSILLGALGLVMGKRADTKVLMDPEKKCIVEVTFHGFDQQISQILEENDLDKNDILIIRREILPAGKSRAFVNDTPATLEVLQNLSAYLVDLHQQWDSLDIHDSMAQMDMLDAFSGIKSESETYRKLYVSWKRELDILSSFEEKQRNSIKEKEFNSFLLEELNQIHPVAGEQQTLEEELSFFENAQKINEVFNKVNHILLDQDISVVSQVGDLVSDLSSIQTIKESYSSLYDRMRSVWEELKDIGREAGQQSDAFDDNPKSAEAIKDRLTMLYKAQKKHGVQDEIGLLEVWDAIKASSNSALLLDEDIEKIKQNIAELELRLAKQASLLRQKRISNSAKLETEIKKLLAQLKMEHAQFVIKLDPENKFNSRGLDAVQWLFAANKGSNLQPIKAVASGGEVSRLNLCIKSVLAHSMTLPTLIFDEIDAGVSGDVAHKMGDLLASLSKNHQIISITHSPQVASKAKQQIFVSKDNSGEKTVTKLKYISGSDRVREIAVMLSSDPPPQSALDTARQLLESVQT